MFSGKENLTRKYTALSSLKMKSIFMVCDMGKLVSRDFSFDFVK